MSSFVAQQVGQGAGARELHVAVRVVFHLGRQLGDDGVAAAVVYAFGSGDHAAPVLFVGGLDVGQKLVDAEGTFRNVDQVRTVIGKFLSQRRRSRQKAGMPAHHHR